MNSFKGFQIRLLSDLLKQKYFFKIYFCIVLLCLLDYVLRNYSEGFNFFVFRGGLLGFGLVSFLVSSCLLLPYRNLVLFVVFVIFSLGFIIDIFCFYHFDSTLAPSMIFTALETNSSEAFAFFKMYLDFKTLCFFFLFVVLIAVFFAFFNLSNKKFFAIILGFVLLGAIQLVSELRWIKPGRSFIERKSIAFVYPLWQFFAYSYSKNQMSKAYAYFQDYKKQMDQKTQGVITTHINNIEKIVLILGESTQRGHMQLYGYSQPTNPYMIELQKSPNLLVFDDVISPHAQTTLSIRKVLSFSHYENEKENPWYQQSNLIPIMKKSNYSTLWISNQERVAVNGNSVGEIASLSQKDIFISDGSKGFDDRVLLPIQKQIHNGEKQFFVIHLMGAHGWYGDRYPNSFAKFNVFDMDSQKRAISLYDNAILYNDYVVNEIFQKFSKNDSIVIYLSDHGEEIYESGEFCGHVDSKINRFMVEIPMLVYVSNLFIQKHPKLYEKLKASIHRPYMSDDLIHTILEIAGIETQEFDPTRSIINEKFNAQRSRIVGGGDGVDYDKNLKEQKAKYN